MILAEKNEFCFLKTEFMAKKLLARNWGSQLISGLQCNTESTLSNLINKHIGLNLCCTSVEQSNETKNWIATIFSWHLKATLEVKKFKWNNFRTAFVSFWHFCIADPHFELMRSSLGNWDFVTLPTLCKERNFTGSAMEIFFWKKSAKSLLPILKEDHFLI